jgi:hypothetical protein
MSPWHRYNRTTVGCSVLLVLAGNVAGWLWLAARP